MDLRESAGGARPPNVFAPIVNFAIFSSHSANSATRPCHLVNSAIVVYPTGSLFGETFSVWCQD